MKKLTGVLVLGLGAAVFLAPPALAREPSLPSGEKTFNRLDENRDGKIAAKELAPRAEKRFMRLDADTDGAVTIAEIDQWLKASADRRRDRIMARMDTDKDGRITAAEVEAHVGGMLGAADADKDGGVTLIEARAYYAGKRKEYFARLRASRTSE